MHSARLVAPLAIAVALSIAGCSSPAPQPTPSATASAAPAPAVAAGDCSVAQVDFFVSAFGIEQADVLTDFTADGYPAIMGTPSCAFGRQGTYIGVYLQATQDEFDTISAAWAAAGFTVTPKDLTEGVLASNVFSKDGADVASLQLGTAAATSAVGGDFMVSAGALEQ
jgi:hypothetical protein